MLETGDLVDIRFQDEARHKKPVGIYWMQAAAVSAAEALGVEDARRSIWVYRLPSQLGAVLSVVLLAWVGAPLVGARAAMLAAAALSLTILLGVEARLAKTDAMILATVLAAQGVLARAWLDPGRARIGWGHAILFWGAIGAGILIKGPITPFIVGLTVAALAIWQRSALLARQLRPVAGAVIALAIAAPWFIAIIAQSGGAFLEESVGRDFIGKLLEGQEKHGAPPGTYLAVVWGVLWPASPFLLLALPAAWRSRREPATAFLIAWVAPAWLIFELVPTKLPHYILPLVPALMLLAARWLMDDGVPGRRLRWPAAGLIVLGAVGVPVAGIAGARILDNSTAFAFLPFAAASACLGLAAAVLLLRNQALRAFAASGLAAMALYAGVYGFAMPQFTAVWPSPRLAAALDSVGCPEPRIATAGFREPSLVFLTRTDLAMTDGAGAAGFLAGEGCRVAFVDRRMEETFRAALGTAAPRLATRVRGLNINGGRQLDIGVWAVGEGR